MFYANILASAALVAPAVGHIIMTSPEPFSSPQVENSPLLAAGTNFPCQGPTGQVYSGSTTSMALGSSQVMTFEGSVVHGGGSCQISLSTDTNPTKESSFKVIHSIEGGCPARNISGNYAADSATYTDPNTYDYTIPSDIPAGKYTLAWSWVNVVGNREFYMNCGAVELTGTSTGDSFDDLPEMFVANLEGINDQSTCTTTENMAVKYPDAGDSIETNYLMPGFSWETYSDACTNTNIPAGSAGATDGAAVATSAAVATAAPAAPTTSSAAVVVSAAPAAAAPTSTSSAVYVAPTPAAPAASASASASSSSTSTSAGHLSGACTTEGEFNCIDSDSFQECASGTWSVVMKMASGMSCTSGQSNTLVMAASAKKRSQEEQHIRGHLMRSRAFRA